MSHSADDLSVIRLVLKGLFEEIHHPGHFRELGVDVNEAFDRAMAAWHRANARELEALDR